MNDTVNPTEDQLNAAQASEDQVTDNDADLSEEELAEELENLKARAKTMGIQIAGNMKAETIRERIRAKLDEELAEEQAKLAAQQATVQQAATAAAPVAAASAPMTANQARVQKRLEMKKKHMALVRCRIANMDPRKKDLHGELFTVVNKYLGTVTKFIPFGEATDDGYHIPRILYENLKAKRFLSISTKKGKNGELIPRTRWLPEYNIEVLEPLTKEELAKLAATQRAAAGLNAE